MIRKINLCHYNWLCMILTIQCESGTLYFSTLGDWGNYKYDSHIYIYYIIETNFCQLSQLPNFFYCNCHVNYPNSGIMVLHYQLMQKRVSFCPIPLAFGSSGTGKTTALRCALGMMGIVSKRLYCSITKEKIVDLCCSSGIPLGVDDPQSKGDISNLIIKLYNGAGVGLLSRGERELKHHA